MNKTDLPSVSDLLVEYERALAYTDSLWSDLSADEVHWRPSADSSAMGWHLGHQPAVAHFMVRNLTAAEPPLDRSFETLMDAATVERDRDPLPSLDRLRSFRSQVAERVRFRVGNIDRGEVGAPAQLRSIATLMLTSIINHEYQHSKWIGETRSGEFGHAMPDDPASDLLSTLDGYAIIQLG